MALTLIKPELDQWGVGEHNGTFRGHNPAFVTATAALREYWTDDTLERATLAKGERVEESLSALASSSQAVELTPKGRGLARGLSFSQPELASKACAAAFERGLLMETSGPSDEVMKIMPPLTITEAELDEGLSVVGEAVRAVTEGVSA
jgi:diaminobutyrate-2-oxoglutarate transaminase